LLFGFFTLVLKEKSSKKYSYYLIIGFMILFLAFWLLQ
jgi:hypothetical protein